MIYFKVIPIFDKTVLYLEKEGELLPFMTLKGNELFTKSELNFLCKKTTPNINNFVKEIQLKKTQTFQSLGARFSIFDKSGY